MEKYELFMNTLKSQASLASYKQEELASIGQYLGNDQVVFKEVYKAYKAKKASYENNPMLGAKVEITFDWKKEEVVIKRLEITLVLSNTAFLRYLNLIDVCFLEIYPIGSVVELDLEMMSEAVRRMYQSSIALVSISGRKVLLGDGKSHYVDYVGRLWPFGEGPLTPPIFLSNAHIKRVVFTGMVDEAEKEFIEKVLRIDVIHSKRKSIAYIPEAEEKEVSYTIKEQNNEKEGVI